MEKREPSYILGENAVGTALVENSMEGLQKIKKKSIAIWSSKPAPEQSYNAKRYLQLNVHSSTIHNSQDTEAIWVSTDTWMDKEDVVYIYNEILLIHKIEQSNAIYRKMDASRDYHTKWSKSEKDKYHMVSFICEI